MGFQIGAFRFDRGSYNSYTLYFKDISGLSRKADVKMAGVKVGWVEDVGLAKDHATQAQAKVMINKEYVLYGDAYAIVRQDGLLGPKFIEIIPGDPLQQPLQANAALAETSIEQTSVDELMRQFKHIASNVIDLTDSIKDAIGGEQGRDQIKTLVANASNTFEQFSNVANILSRSLMRNENNLDSLIGIGDNFKQMAQMLQEEVFPSFQKSIEKISEVFDRDFDRLASHLSTTAESLQETSEQARQGLSSLSSVAEKIDEGKGLLGKLINEDEIYGDLRSAIHGFKSYMAKMERLQIVFDGHFESMYRSAESYEFEDSKGYFDVRIYPNEDHFYLIQLASSQKGFIERKERIHRFIDHNLDTIDLSKLNLPGFSLVHDVLRRQTVKLKRNTLKLGLQFGKIFGDIALRFGLFEGSAGVGIDIDIPFRCDRFRWVTTLEVFDMSGWNRLDDRRPHFKWLNRMYFSRNLYFTFGADDFVSKRNASAFVGAGLRFGDDDIKYLLSSISSVGSSAIS